MIVPKELNHLLQVSHRNYVISHYVIIRNDGLIMT